MTIELNDESYVVGIWFSSNPKTHNDWMTCVIADPDRPGYFKGWSRFRITKDEKIWDSEDTKKWTQFASQEGYTEDSMIQTMDATQETLKVAYQVTDKIIVKGSLKDMIKLSKGKDWLNIKHANMN